MYCSKCLISMLAVGGLFVATQQAGAVIVPSATDDNLLNAGVLLESTSHFEGNTGFIFEATATSDGNQFASIGVQDGAGFAGFARHIDPVAASFALNGTGTLAEGMAVRMSAWVMSSPHFAFSNPAGGEDGFRFEFLNVPLGNGDPNADPNDLILATPLSPIGTGLSNTAWTQKSFSFELSNNPANVNNFVDFTNLQEIRAVVAQSGGPGATGELYVDNFKLEVFPTLSAANDLVTNPLLGPAPGGFDIPLPPPVLNGDLDNDGFVGITDLNIILGNWNASPPPPSLAPVLLSDFSGFALTGSYVEWDPAGTPALAPTFTDNGTDWTVEANDFGGGWFDFAGTLDATGRTELELQLDINAGNAADKFNIVLFDADGTERVYRFLDLVTGDGQTLKINLDDFLQDNAPGTIPGLDLATLDLFHIQGTFENGQPGLLLDLTLDNLALIEGVPLLAGDVTGDDFVGIEDLNVVLGEWNLGTPPPPGGASIPEPASLSLLALGGLAMLRRRSA